MLLYTRLAQPKAPKKRSRAGCTYCKEKKKKCDEARPRCSRCQEHSQDCTYEPIKPRQRRKRDSSAAERGFPQGVIAGHEPQTPHSGMSIGPTDHPNLHLHQQLGLDDGLCDDAASIVDGGNLMSHIGPSHLSTTATDMAQILAWSPTSTAVFSPMSPTFDIRSLDGRSVIQDEDDVEEIVRRDSMVTAVSSGSCNSLAFVSPQLPTPSLEFCSPIYSEFSTRQNRRVLVDHFCNVLSHLIVLRENEGNPFQQLVLPLGRNSPVIMDAIYALASAHLEFRGVQNQEKSEQFHGRAIQSLAVLIEQGNAVNKNELLAAIMLLVYYEVLVQKGRSNIVHGHLKGAMTIMENRAASTDPTGVFLERAFRFYDVIAALSFGTAPLSSAPGCGSLSPLAPLDSRGAASPNSSVDTLLGMATTLWPIIHRLSNLCGLKDELNQAIAQRQTSKAAVLRTELEATATAIQVALRQWQPILPPEYVPNQNPEDMTPERSTEQARLQSILNNALAYRHSAFVYLYRTIHLYPRSHPLVQQHAHISLTHCIGTVSSEGPRGALLWPLFVAACEATSTEDREQARQAFEAIDRRQGMTNIERAWCIVQEVWRRSDEAELTMLKRAEDEEFTGEDAGEGRQPGWYARSAFRRTTRDLWRRVSKDMGVTIVFG